MISDGVAGLAKASSGKFREIIGTVTKHPNFPGGPIGDSKGAEGTAMIEIIHDIAPDAEIFFVGVGDPPGREVDGEEALIQGIDWFLGQEVNGVKIEPRVDIIVDDIGFFGEPFFQDGRVAQAVRRAISVTGGNVLFVSAAGNDNGDHYQAPLHMDVDLNLPLTDRFFYHFFKPGEGGNRLPITIPAKNDVDLTLQWSGDFSNPIYNFTLALVDETGKVLDIDRGIGWPDTKRKALRSVSFKNTSGTKEKKVFAVIAVGNVPGDDELLPGEVRDVVLELFSGGRPFDVEVGAFNTPLDQIFGHPAVPGVLTVGAISSQDPGVDDPEGFSSRGPSTMFDPILQEFSERNSLQVMAIDQVSVSGAGGFSTKFRGTSAAAPHMAGIGAPLMEFRRQAGRDDILQALRDTATDLSLKPIAVNDVIEARDNQPIEIDVLGNDIDPDQTVLGPDALRLPLRLVEVKPISAADFTTKGMVQLDGQVVRYTPPPVPATLTDKFEYVVEDSDGDRTVGTVAVRVGVFVSPVPVPDSAIVAPDAEVVIRVLDNDIDPRGVPLRIITHDAATAHGGVIRFGEDPRTLVYLAPQGFVGEDTFDYVVGNLLGEPTVGTVVVEVLDPTALAAFKVRVLDDLVLTDSDGASAAVDVLANDINPRAFTVDSQLVFDETQLDVSAVGSTLTIAPKSGVGHGSYELNYLLKDSGGRVVEDAGGNIVLGTARVLVNDVGLPVGVPDRVLASPTVETRLQPLANDLNLAGGRWTSSAWTTRPEGSCASKATRSCSTRPIRRGNWKRSASIGSGRATTSLPLCPTRRAKMGAGSHRMPCSMCFARQVCGPPATQ